MKTEEGVTQRGRRRLAKATNIPVNKTSAEALKAELDSWLSNRTLWNHDDWLALLGGLRSKGYSDLIDTQKGQDAIGLYLETNRRRYS